MTRAQADIKRKLAVFEHAKKAGMSLRPVDTLVLPDKSITNVYIKPRSPHLNGKVERSHSTDQREF